MVQVAVLSPALAVIVAEPAFLAVTTPSLTVATEASEAATGRGVITVTATDGVGASASMDVTVVAKDADAPISIPMTGRAPGVYYVNVTYRGKTYRKAFVKI